MLNIRNLPIEPPPINLSKPPVAPVENCGEIAKHFPQRGKTPYQGKPHTTPSATKRVSYPPTHGREVDLLA